MSCDKELTPLQLIIIYPKRQKSKNLESNVSCDKELIPLQMAQRLSPNPICLYTLYTSWGGESSLFFFLYILQLRSAHGGVFFNAQRNNLTAVWNFYFNYDDFILYWDNFCSKLFSRNESLTIKISQRFF